MTAMNDVSPKVSFSAVGTAVATLIWTLVAALTHGIFSDASIAPLTGATGTIVGFMLGFLVSDQKRA